MKVLVIGSKGFIGSHVYNYFHSQPGVEVWGCDVATDYAATNYFLVDATNADFEFIFKTRVFDVCVNCSGAASVPESMINPLRDYYLNTKNVINILDAIRRNFQTCKFLNLSSAAVYGNPRQLPVSEDHPIKPVSPYGWHKYQSELLCQEYHEVFGLPTCCARIFSAYGSGLQKQLFWDWYQKAKQQDEILLIGTGNESRDFIFIDDVVQAIGCIVSNGKFASEAINVANGKQVFISDAIELFRKASDRDFRYRFNNEIRRGDPLNWVADISRLSTLGYKQRYSMESGIRHYINWLRQ